MGNEAFKGKLAGVIVGGDSDTNHRRQFGDDTIKKMTDAGPVNTWCEAPRDEHHACRRSDRFEPTTFAYTFVRGLEATAAKLVEVSYDACDH